MNLNKESAYLDTINRYAKRECDFLNQIGELREKLFNQAREIRMQIEEENKNKAANNETFTQGELDKVIKNLKNLVDIQCSTGNWNYDPYMQGMANGLICALACLTGEEPKYMSAPKKWLKDCHVECQSVGEAGQTQPQKPKKTVLKAPAIMKGGWLSNNLFETPAEAQAYYRDESDYSFPATIRMKDGSDLELWFPVEEE